MNLLWFINLNLKFKPFSFNVVNNYCKIIKFELFQNILKFHFDQFYIDMSLQRAFYVKFIKK